MQGRVSNHSFFHHLHYVVAILDVVVVVVKCSSRSHELAGDLVPIQVLVLQLANLSAVGVLRAMREHHFKAVQ